MDYSKRKQQGRVKEAELADRIDHCLTLLARGSKRAQILVDSRVRSWGMTDSSIDKYIKHAKNEIVGNAQQARTEHLGRAVMNLDYLYIKALEADDLKLCLDCQKEKNRLLKLSDVYRPPSGEVEEVMPADVRKLIDKVRVVNPPRHEKFLEEDYGKDLLVGASK